MKFKCTVESCGGESAIVANGSYCAYDPRTDQETCVCADSQRGGDNLIYHFPNCALPSTPWTFRIYFIEISVITLFILVLALWEIYRTSKVSRSIGIFVAASLLLGWAFMFSIEIETGCYVGCAIVQPIFYSVVCYMAVKVIVSIADLHSSVKRNTTAKIARRVGKASWVFFTVTTMSIGIAMAVTTRDEGKQHVYKDATFALGVMLWGGATFVASTLTYYSTLLMGIITELSTFRGKYAKKAAVVAGGVKSDEATSGGTRTEEDASVTTMYLVMRGFIPRLFSVRLGSTLLFLLMFSLLVASPAVYFSLTSIPYYWVVTFVQYHFFLVFCLGIVIFLHRVGEKTKNNNKGVKPYRSGSKKSSSSKQDNGGSTAGRVVASVNYFASIVNTNSAIAASSATG